MKIFFYFFSIFLFFFNSGDEIFNFGDKKFNPEDKEKKGFDNFVQSPKITESSKFTENSDFIESPKSFESKNSQCELNNLENLAPEENLFRNNSSNFLKRNKKKYVIIYKKLLKEGEIKTVPFVSNTITKKEKKIKEGHIALKEPNTKWLKEKEKKWSLRMNNLNKEKNKISKKKFSFEEKEEIEEKIKKEELKIPKPFKIIRKVRNNKKND